MVRASGPALAMSASASARCCGSGILPSEEGRGPSHSGVTSIAPILRSRRVWTCILFPPAVPSVLDGDGFVLCRRQRARSDAPAAELRDDLLSELVEPLAHRIERQHQQID